MALGRKFACLLPTPATEAKLRRLSERFGFDTSVAYDGTSPHPFMYHMTLLFSQEDDIDYPDTIMPLGHTLSVNGAVVTTLGKAVVLKTTTTPKLLQVRRNLTKNIGGSSAFPDWIPHVSLTYAPADIDKFGNDPVPYWYKKLSFDRIQVKTST